MKTVPLGEVATITMGQAPPGHSYNDRGDGVPLIAGAGDFKDGHLSPGKYTTDGGKLCEAHDIVLSIRASIGAMVWADGIYCLGRGVAGIRAGSEVDRNFLWHWMSSTERELASKGKGATFLQVNRTDIAELTFPLFPLDEQRRIAAILDHADALRAKRRQVLAHLDALPQAIFHEMFSGLDLPEASGREAMPLIRNGVSPSTKGTVDADVLTLSSVTRGRFDPGAIKRATFDITPGQDKRVSATDFLMCRGNGNLHLVGRGVLPNADRPDLVFPDTVIAGRIDTTVVHPRYLETVWSQRATRDQIEGGARTTNGTHKINQQLIARVRIPIPPLENQREYARRVALVDEQRAVSVSALAQADELFASLQSRAFRGEL